MWTTGGIDLLANVPISTTNKDPTALLWVLPEVDAPIRVQAVHLGRDP